MTGGLVVLLNGTSSSGKSSLARALQERWDGPLVDAGLDRHLSSLPRRFLSTEWASVYAYVLDASGAVAAVETGPVGRRLVRGMHRAAAALARSGLDVVVDHVVLDGETADDLAAATAGLEVVRVGVLCPVDVLVAREAARGDRTIGQAAAQLPAVHAHGPYDIEVDTSRLDPAAGASLVLDRLGRPTGG